MTSAFILSAILASGFVGAAERELAFYDIVPYSPGCEAELARDIRDVHETTGLDTFLYCVSLDPRGVPAFDGVTAATASFRKLKAELKDAPVKLGFLLQSILGHWPRTDKETEPWQRTIDQKGAVSRFCLMDPRYQDYIRKTAAALAAEKPCYIMTDDDIRAFSPTFGLECFCPLHAAEFNRRTGRSYSAEEYRLASFKFAGGDKDSEVFGDLLQEIPMTAVRLVREGIDSVDPKLPGSACMSGVEQLVAAPRAKAMAAAGQPVTIRLANGQYSEVGRNDLIGYTLLTQAHLDFYRGEIDRFLDESDTFPHTLYARSGRTFGSKLALGIFCGVRGAKLWLVGMHKGAERVPVAYDRALAENRKFFEALAKTLEGSVPAGVRVPAFRPQGKYPLGSPRFFAESAWPTAILGIYGVPFRPDFSRDAGDILLLGGAGVVERMTDADLAAALRGRVFVDGPAALKLSQRGFGKSLGCTPVADGHVFNIERVVSNTNGTLQPPIAKSASVPALTCLAAGAKTLSELRFAPAGANAPTSEFVAASEVLNANIDGGTVLTASFDAASEYQAQNLRRKAWLVMALRTLDPSFPVVCENAEPNLTLARKGADGRTYAFTLNLSYDDIDTLHYSAAQPMAGMEVLGADGIWRKTNVVHENGVWKITKHLPCMGFSVVRW